MGAGAAEVYITDGPTTLAVFTVPASGTPSAWHFNLLAGDRIVGRQPSVGSRLYYHRDRLNSTRAVVTGTTVVESRDYDPWGVELAGRTLGSGTKEGFTGQERDAESGLDAFWARAYGAAFARWASVDPLRDSFPEWTPYNYVEGNPVAYTDPLGDSIRFRNAEAEYYYQQLLRYVGRMASSPAQATRAAGVALGGMLRDLEGMRPTLQISVDEFTSNATGILNPPEAPAVNSNVNTSQFPDLPISVQLAHELGHAHRWLYLGEGKPNDYEDPNSPSNYFSIRAENWVRRHLGCLQRPLDNHAARLPTPCR